MPKPNSGLANRTGIRYRPRHRCIYRYLIPGLALALAGCATPQYALRPTPVPEESAEALEIERGISAVQAEEFERLGARRLGWNERVRGLDVQGVVDRLSRVTERPALHYRASLYAADDPNAAALADGRIYLSTGMVNYLAGRGGRVDELAFVLAHELAHTVAQHLVKRYRMLQRQQVVLAFVAAGAAAAARGGEGAQQAGQLAVDAAGLLQDVANSGYSQEQELEADQLGIRYVSRAGFEPWAALDLLQDFSRFDYPWPFLRTHPYMSLRRDYLARYLAETRPVSDTIFEKVSDTGTARKALQDAQRLYPKGSVSWQNLQRQLDALDR